MRSGFLKEEGKEFKFKMSKIRLPSLKISDKVNLKINFPKIKIPEEIAQFDINEIQKIVIKNSQNGWTITEEITYIDYFKEELIDSTKKEQDYYFSNYYYKNEKENFERIKIYILENIESKWTELLKDTFDSFDNNKYKIVIPVLFTLIEGQMSSIFGPYKRYAEILKIIQDKLKNEESEFKKIFLYSVEESIKKHLFVTNWFTEERKEIINRHWVLHGRDDPGKWEKVDALRLYNVISSLQYIKKIFAEE